MKLKMLYSRLFLFITRKFFLFALGILVSNHAIAAKFEVDFSNGAGTSLGYFDAPITGGAVSNFTVTIQITTYDIPALATSFEYDPLINEFTSYAPSFPSFTNSVASADCPVMKCGLTLFPNSDPLVPGDYSAVNLDSFANVDDGTKYVIDPTPMKAVPIPAALPLLLSGLTIILTVRKKVSS